MNDGKGTGPLPKDADFVALDAATDAHARADELFVHGALGALHERASGAMDRRLDRLSSAIRQSPKEPGRRAASRRLRRFSGVAIVLAATLMTAWIFVSVSTNQARATLMASIQAARGLGDRRYEVRITSASDQSAPEQPEAVFDSNGPDFLLRVRAPGGHTAIAGKDSIGEWAIRREGGIERAEPRRAWPRWATADGEPIFADSIDKLLEVLTSGFELQILDSETVDGREFRRIVGAKREGASRGLADRVELWIDAETMVLEKMEMEWTHRPGERRPAGSADPRYPGGPLPLRAPERDGPPNRPALDGPPPPGGHRPPPPDADPTFRPPPPPGFEGGPAAARRGGIRKLTVSRQNAPEWAANWFSPEAHEDGMWGVP
ncbi:MAG: hypothetical protein KF805_14650 [Phycisphaeraceae bacterium]|nr:hypothetical protein [Phycisphaeraceae bacterium]